MTAPLDPRQDPDRYDPAKDSGQRNTLPGLLGDGAQEEPRDNYVWLAGLLSVLTFLGLVAFVVGRLDQFS